MRLCETKPNYTYYTKLYEKNSVDGSPQNKPIQDMYG